jgi:signal transduction histidine kinase
MTAAVIALGVLCAGLTVYLLLLSRQLRGMARELERTREPGYDRQLTVTLMNGALETLASACNENLRYQSALRNRQQQAEQNLRQSVSDIAHDLRTPLTALQGNLQLAVQDASLSDRTAALLAVCTEKSDLLRRMADDFFEMALLESDHSPVPLSRVSLTAELMQLLADSEAAIRLKGLTPEIDLPERAVFAQADAALTQRMLGNLLSNVLKYAHGSFTVRLTQQDGFAEVIFANAVQPGEVPDPERLFDRSYRADRARGGQGAGLGLYIVRLLAERQNAAVSAAVQANVLTLTVRFRSA